MDYSLPPTPREMEEIAAAKMASRLGRPPIDPNEKAKPYGVSLTPQTYHELQELKRVTKKRRSECIADAVALWSEIISRVDPALAESFGVGDAMLMLPGALVGSLSGMTPVPALSDHETDRATAIANQALAAWISPERTLDEVGAAMETFYAAAVKVVRTNR